ncbi:MAG: hypothetical protein CSB44_10250 [Gammaproteobacteria bacterium]|nr:MAG: hypothetical protein CSB44_10250 [Gammaproteobacteria bacterium]
MSPPQWGGLVVKVPPLGDSAIQSDGVVISPPAKGRTALRTIVYVDGFNFYYGCLKRPDQRHLRWLDLESLCSFICRENNPKSEIVSVKFFTAPITSKLSARGEASHNDQQNYWRALEGHCPHLEIIEGSFYLAQGELHERIDGRSDIDFNKAKIKVWRPEEKQTDVNIALHMMTDAFDRKCNQQVLVSNDSDCTPVLQTIGTRFENIRLGVIAPILEGSQKRRPSSSLSDAAHWSRRVIRQDELEAHQLPDNVTVVKKKTRIRKRPSYWSRTD